MTDTEVEVYTEPAASELEQWGRDAHLISQVAVRLAKTAFVPASYDGDAGQVTAAILTGQEIGLSPMASLRSIDIIQGVPGMRAIAMRALVQSEGHEIWTVESTATRAIVKGQRKGSEKVETSEWTIDRAQKLGLMQRPNWKNQPIAMLLARATSECARLIAADKLLGIPYSTEELQDEAGGAVAEGAGEAPVKRAGRKVQRAPLEATRAAEPEPDGAEDPQRVGDRAAIEAAASGAPEEVADAIGGEAVVEAEEKLAAEAREKARREFEERPPMDEPMVDWAPPTDADAPPAEEAF